MDFYPRDLGARYFRIPAATVEYHLTIGAKTVNFTGTTRRTLAVNNLIPAATLTFHEGDVAHIHVTNSLQEDASMHWHGMLVPNGMDGIPFITYPPIKPGATFDYEFPIRQTGTYWYHSHSRLQEQKGLYGAIVILPRRGKATGDRDQVAVLSDWMDGSPHETLRWLKRGSEWSALERGNSQSMLGAIKAERLGDFWKRELLRMPPMDLADIAYDRFLVNGQTESRLAGKGGETVRVRLVNGSSSTFFYLQFASGPMTIVSADGQNVEPVKKDRVLMGVAETYDVLVRLPGPGAYELRATAQDGSAFTSLWIGDGPRKSAPDVPHANLYNAMGKLTPGKIFALTPGGTMGMPDGMVNAGKFDRPGPMMSMAEMMDSMPDDGMKGRAEWQTA